MAKLTLDDLANLENENSAVSTINSNNSAIETALENTLSRDGTSPNTMGASLDMNNNRILNLPEAASDNEPVRKAEFDEVVASLDSSAVDAAVAEAEGYASQAQASATSAAASLDSFDDRYLGAKSSDPSTDNDGNSLLIGALYFNTSSNEMRVWDGDSWEVAYKPSASSVDSVFGRTGAVTAQTSDYDADQVDVTPAGNIAATDVQAALEELDTEKAAKSQTAEFISGMILGSLSDRDYRILIKVPHAGTITETVTRSVSGTATATFKVNTTALGGTANSVSSSEQAQTHASSNTFSANDDIVITISSNSSCVDLSFTIKYTRSFS